MTTHTPGPWNIDFGYNNIINSIGPCFPDQYAGNAWLKVPEADARLIAAAPDLLVAIKSLLSCIDPQDFPDEIAFADAAIAKATGETKCPH